MSQLTNKVIEKKDWQEKWKTLVLDVFLKSKPKAQRYPVGQLEKRGIEFIQNLLTQELESLEEKVREEMRQEAINLATKWKKSSEKYSEFVDYKTGYKNCLNNLWNDLHTLGKLSSHPLQDKEDDLPNIHPNACECRICYKDKQTARKYVKKNFGDVIKKLSER